MNSFLFPILSFFVIALIFVKNWMVSGGTLASGDWPYLFKENIREFSFLHHIGSLWLVPYYQITAKVFVEYFGLPWEMAERIFWFWPFVLLSIFSSYFLFRSWIAVLIYLTNTYILMVVGGGQMGVAIAYSMAPLVLGRFIKFIDGFRSTGKIFNFQFSIFNSFITGLVLTIQVMFDPRIAYVTFIAIFLYWIFNLFVNKTCLLSSFFKSIISVFAVPIFITLMINSFWILPFILGKTSLEVESFGSLAGFKFLSFADFPHGFSLLHPNWPENIFGKIYFLQPEFLLLPIFAYSSLLFISKIKNQKLETQSKNQKIESNLAIEQFSNRTIVFFAVLGLAGAFLAKGVNPPFGEINSFLFQYFPGMSMFRDATKFYPLIIFGYGFLIPLTLEKLSKKIPYGKLFTIVFVIFWMVLIRQGILGELGGTFKSRTVPVEYIRLKDYLVSQPDSFSILWIPFRQRFGFSSKSHPDISAAGLFNNIDSKDLAKMISKDKNKINYNKLKKLNIQYVIVPYDSEKELFILDRKYSGSLRQRTIDELDKTSWLVKISQFHQIAIYKVK